MTHTSPDICSVDGCVLPVFARGWCEPHYARARRNNGDPRPDKPLLLRSRTPEERFWSKVDKNGPIPDARPDLGPCWLWTGSCFAKGYGNIRWDGENYAHRVAYLLEYGSIPPASPDAQIDHLCRVPACVNPSHLELVTYYENQARGIGTVIARSLTRTQCPRGHPFDDQNTYRLPKGGRICRICQLASQRAWYHRKKAAS